MHYYKKITTNQAVVVSQKSLEAPYCHSGKSRNPEVSTLLGSLLE
jgi:hypothetical protein